MPTSLSSTECLISSPSYQIESVADWAKDSAPLVYRHWQELGLDLDLKIRPDIDRMTQMEHAGIWKTFTVRREGRLLGYVLAVLSPHLHYSTSAPMLIVDAYYILPEYRQGTGAKLLKFVEAMAKQWGAIKIYLSCKVHEDHSDLFKALGFKLSDYAFIKRI